MKKGKTTKEHGTDNVKTPESCFAVIENGKGYRKKRCDLLKNQRPWSVPNKRESKTISTRN